MTEAKERYGECAHREGHADSNCDPFEQVRTLSVRNINTGGKRMNKYGPKKNNHPSIGNPCPVCGIKFKENDYTTLAVIGVDNEEDRQKMIDGRVYNAVAKEIHWTCRII